MKRPPATRNSKRLFTLLVLSILVAIVVVPMLGGRTSASAEVGESHEAVVAQGEHVVAEGHGVEAGEHAAEGHEAEGHGVGHVEEPWWRFTGWEVVFAVLATVFFLFLTRWLPLILEDKSGGSSL